MENIHVIARLRPLTHKEVQKGEENIWKTRANTIELIESKHTIYQIKKQTSNPRTSFTFDNCYNEFDNNAVIYIKSIKHLIMSRYSLIISLKGFNGTVFMYGQTGSGKTHTMLGKSSPQQSPLLYSSLNSLYDAIQSDIQRTFTIKCSYLQIYNDTVYDLLSEGQMQGLTVIQNDRKQFQVKGAMSVSVISYEQCRQVIRKGQINRHYAQTHMNHCSSRSHVIFRLHIHSFTNEHIRSTSTLTIQFRSNERNINNRKLIQQLIQLQQQKDKYSKGTIIMQSVLNFVDLAGSQKVSNHWGNVQKQSNIRINEVCIIYQGKHINKSLFFLTQVIALRAQGKSNSHIPFRNSPLTKILRSSFGGNSRTCIILCLCPVLSALQQSISTLRFGVNAKRIQNRIEANIQSHDDEAAIRMMILEYQKKIRDMQLLRIQDRGQIGSLGKELQKATGQQMRQKQGQIKGLHLQILQKDEQAQTIKKKYQNLKKLGSNMNTKKQINLKKDQFKEQLFSQKCGHLFSQPKHQPAQQSILGVQGMQMIYDYQGKFIMHGYRIIKRQLQLYQQKARSYKKYFDFIKKDYLENVQFTNQLKVDFRVSQVRLESSQDRVAYLEKQLALAYQEIHIYKNHNLQNVPCSQLVALENHFTKGLEKIKSSRIISQFSQALLKDNPSLQIKKDIQPKIQLQIYKNYQPKNKDLKCLKSEQKIKLNEQIDQIKKTLELISFEQPKNSQISWSIQQFQKDLKRVMKQTYRKVSNVLRQKEKQILKEVKSKKSNACVQNQGQCVPVKQEILRKHKSIEQIGIQTYTNSFNHPNLQKGQKTMSQFKSISIGQKHIKLKTFQQQQLIFPEYINRTVKGKRKYK